MTKLDRMVERFLEQHPPPPPPRKMMGSNQQIIQRFFMKKAIVTGGEGFIGKALVSKLEKYGIEVIFWFSQRDNTFLPHHGHQK